MKASTFALAVGAFVGGTGLLGMVKPLREDTYEKWDEMNGTTGYGKIAGIVPTNDLFNWVRVAIGAAGIAASFDEETAKIYNRTVAASYAGMAVMGVIPKTDTMFGTMPIFGANVFLHAGVAAAELLTEEDVMSSALETAKGYLAELPKSLEPLSDMVSGATLTQHTAPKKSKRGQKGSRTSAAYQS